MPTLIRLFLVLAVLAGLGFAGMITLTVMVDPGEKDITVRIPARELVPGGDTGTDVIDLGNLPPPVNVIPAEPSAPADESDESGVETVVAPGTE